MFRLAKIVCISERKLAERMRRRERKLRLCPKTKPYVAVKEGEGTKIPK